MKLKQTRRVGVHDELLFGPLLQGFRSTKSGKKKGKIAADQNKGKRKKREREKTRFTQIPNETHSLSLFLSPSLSIWPIMRAWNAIFVFETRYKLACRIIATNSRRDGIVNILKSETTPAADCSVLRV